MNSIKCIHCKKEIPFNEDIGTKNRNHCPFCLYSKHLDENIPGDRKSNCKFEMKPICLTFKNEGIDKYGKKIQGEIMVVHECCNPNCKKISINRIAGDDDPNVILEVLDSSISNKIVLPDSIVALNESDRDEVKNQLFGIDR